MATMIIQPDGYSSTIDVPNETYIWVSVTTSDDTLTYELSGSLDGSWWEILLNDTTSLETNLTCTAPVRFDVSKYALVKFKPSDPTATYYTFIKRID